MVSSGLVLRDTEKSENDPQVEHPVSKDTDWGELHEKAKARDSEKMKVHDSEVDTLLVFAGLFSAILTAFIIDVYKDLKVDSGDIAANTLQKILALMEHGHPSRSLPEPMTHAQPLVKAQSTRTLSTVVLLWFISLLLSLAAALTCIFMKQWLHAYSKWAEPSSFLDSLVLRGFYQLSLHKWQLYVIFTALGVLLQLALVFFVVGLVIYLWTFTHVISPVVTFLVIVVIGASFSALILPLMKEDCPYKFPSSHWVDRDLPVARRLYATQGQQSDRALRETALVLDMPPAAIEDAIRDAGSTSRTPGMLARTAMNVVQTGVRQLSPSSIQLLIAVLTREDLLAAHKRGFEDQASLDHAANALLQNRWPTAAFPSEQLLRLWRLIFLAMENPPTAVARLLSHLAETLGLDKPSEQEHAELLADLLDHCGKLGTEGKLPEAELSKHALKVYAWSQKGDGSSSHLVALRALYHATKHIPESVRVKSPESGLSPVTPYMELLRSLKEGIKTTGTLAVAKSLHDWADRVTHSTALLDALVERHNSFLCTRSRAYYPKVGTTANPRSGVFSSDCRKLYIGSDEAEAWVLDLQSGLSETLTPSSLPSSTAYHFATVSRNGRWIVWGSREGRTLVVDTTETPPKQYPLEDSLRGSSTIPLTISWDNKYVILSGEDSWADVVDISTTEVIMSFEEHTRRLYRAAFSLSSSNLVATSSFDGTVKVWDILDGLCLRTFETFAYCVNAVAWSPDGVLIAISSYKTVRIYEWGKEEPLRATLDGHTNAITGLCFSPNGKLLGSSASDHTVRVWSVEKESCIAVLTGPKEDFSWVEFSSDGGYITGVADSSVWIWDINPESVYAAV